MRHCYWHEPHPSKIASAKAAAEHHPLQLTGSGTQWNRNRSNTLASLGPALIPSGIPTGSHLGSSPTGAPISVGPSSSSGQSGTTASRHRTAPVKKSIKNLFTSAPKFTKTMKRGLYLASIFYTEDRVLVTNDDNLPIVEVDESYPTSALLADFQWMLKIACTWSDVKALRIELDKTKSSSTAHFRLRLLYAVEALQSALGIKDLGRFHYAPLRDHEGTTVLVTARLVPDPRAISSLSVRWASQAKFYRKFLMSISSLPPTSAGYKSTIGSVTYSSTNYAHLNASSPDNSDSSIGPERTSFTGHSVSSTASTTAATTSGPNPRIGEILLSSFNEVINHSRAMSRPLPRGLYLGYIKLKSTVDTINVLSPRRTPSIVPHVRVRHNSHVTREEWLALRQFSAQSVSPVDKPQRAQSSVELSRQDVAGVKSETSTNEVTGDALRVPLSRKASADETNEAAVVASTTVQPDKESESGAQSDARSASSASSHPPPVPSSTSSVYVFDQLQMTFLRSIGTAAKILLKNMDVSESVGEAHRLYDVEVVELSDSVSFILLIPPVESVCLVPGQSDPLIERSEFSLLPLQIFELGHMCIYQYPLVMRYARMSNILEMDIMVAQQAHREAFSAMEMAASKARLEQLQDLQCQVDDSWRGVRWIMDVVSFARDKTATGHGIAISSLWKRVPPGDEADLEELLPSDSPLVKSVPTIFLSASDRDKIRANRATTSDEVGSPTLDSIPLSIRRPSRDDSEIGLNMSTLKALSGTTSSANGNRSGKGSKSGGLGVASSSGLGASTLGICLSTSTYSLLDVFRSSSANSGDSPGSSDAGLVGGGAFHAGDPKKSSSVSSAKSAPCTVPGSNSITPGKRSQDGQPRSSAHQQQRHSSGEVIEPGSFTGSTLNLSTQHSLMPEGQMSGPGMRKSASTSRLTHGTAPCSTDNSEREEWSTASDMATGQLNTATMGAVDGTRAENAGTSGGIVETNGGTGNNTEVERNRSNSSATDFELDLNDTSAPPSRRISTGSHLSTCSSIVGSGTGSSGPVARYSDRCSLENLIGHDTGTATSSSARPGQPTPGELIFINITSESMDAGDFGDPPNFNSDLSARSASSESVTIRATSGADVAQSDADTCEEAVRSNGASTHRHNSITVASTLDTVEETDVNASSPEGPL